LLGSFVEVCYYPLHTVNVELLCSWGSFSLVCVEKTLFTSKLDLNLRKKLVKCYIWSMALYGAETWMLRTADQKYLESFEMCCWRRMEKISWLDHARIYFILFLF
jgi:hypothetical protein